MVLNECAARLGVSLRQTEDQLTRDMLASTASLKLIELDKFSLIDLETEVVFN